MKKTISVFLVLVMTFGLLAMCTSCGYKHVASWKDHEEVIKNALEAKANAYYNTEWHMSDCRFATDNDTGSGWEVSGQFTMKDKYGHNWNWWNFEVFVDYNGTVRIITVEKAL